jgi:dipeptidyl aminopeptidase/acylaminoacyl peptidase
MFGGNMFFARALLLALGILLAWGRLADQASAAGVPTKRPLRHSDYASWCAIQGTQLSPDGTFVAYALMPQEGDGQFVLRNLRTGQEWRHPCGARAQRPPRPPAAGRPARRAAGAAAASASAFTADGRFVVFPIRPSAAERQKARAARPPVEPVGHAGIVELATGRLTRLERVRSFHVPEDGPAILVYLVAPPPVRPSRAALPSRSRRHRPVPQPVRERQARRAAAGPAPGRLILRNLGDGRESSFSDVSSFTLSKDGLTLVYAVSAKKNSDCGVFAVSPRFPDRIHTLSRAPGRFSRLTWDEKQTCLAFVQRQGEPPAGPVHLWYWRRPAPGAAVAWGASPSAAGLALAELLAGLAGGAATDLTPALAPALSSGWQVSDSGALAISPDGARLYFGVAPRLPAPQKQNAGAETAAVELWHWKDDYIKPMQKVRAPAERTRSYRAAYDFATRTARRLGDETLADVRTAPAGDWAIGVDDRPYRVLVGHEGGAPFADYYVVDLRTGKRKAVLKKQLWPVTWSPGGRFALYFDGKDWNTLSIPDGRVANLTARLGVRFGREQHDMPGVAPPYGVGGWTDGDRQVLLYDRYDVWLAASDGSGARNLTGGRKSQTRFRYVVLDPRARSLDPRKPLLLRAEEEATQDTGFYRSSLNGSPPVRLLWSPCNYGPPLKARNADVLVLTASTFHTFPDLHATDPSFKDLRRVSCANPQKAGLRWGRAELVHFKSADGVALRGILLKPDNFDPKKKYPLLVYIYERLSERLHNFVDPAPGTSVNVSYYASNGYLVLLPDIAYSVGYPGASALKCVLPAVQAVADRGFVDENAIGIQGHSWGGYQVAYLATRTTRFKAMAAGAPVANMTSAYSGIRWGPGLARQFQYEWGQSRIGGTLWQYPTRFIENSPVFMADRVRAPLLVLHNDQDDAVPWYQGIELYLALRRLGKEAYLFNYPGEAHGLRRRVNQKDYTLRLQEFFDHHLKGAPRPAWMDKGLPYVPPSVGRRPAAGERP